MGNKQIGRPCLLLRAAKTTQQGRGGKSGCEEDGVGRAVREGSLEAVI